MKDIFWAVIGWAGTVVLVGFVAKINYYIFMWGWNAL